MRRIPGGVAGVGRAVFLIFATFHAILTDGQISIIPESACSLSNLSPGSCLGGHDSFLRGGGGRGHPIRNGTIFV